MPALDRQRLIHDLFGKGMPPALASALGITEPSWLLLNMPTARLVGGGSAHLHDTIDVVGGALVPRQGADISGCERSASFHYGGRGQEQQRSRFCTELALGHRLLEPEISDSLFVLQFALPCGDADPDHLGTALIGAGLQRAAVLGGADAPAVEDPHQRCVSVAVAVEDDDGKRVLVVDRAHGRWGERVRGTRIVQRNREEMLVRLAQAMSEMEMPRRLPCVINLGSCPQ